MEVSEPVRVFAEEINSRFDSPLKAALVEDIQRDIFDSMHPTDAEVDAALKHIRQTCERKPSLKVILEAFLLARRGAGLSWRVGQPCKNCGGVGWMRTWRGDWPNPHWFNAPCSCGNAPQWARQLPRFNHIEGMSMNAFESFAGRRFMESDFDFKRRTRELMATVKPEMRAWAEKHVGKDFRNVPDSERGGDVERIADYDDGEFDL